MATAQQSGSAVREELEHVFSSTCFARSEGLSRLLRFLVERQLEGRGSELKESLIGVEVYGRRPDYDPKLDSTVRSEMARLRARLGKYYSTEGILDPVVIELPKGSYVPGFRLTTLEVAKTRPRRLWLAACFAALGHSTVGRRPRNSGQHCQTEGPQLSRNMAKDASLFAISTFDISDSHRSDVARQIG